MHLFWKLSSIEQNARILVSIPPPRYSGLLQFIPYKNPIFPTSAGIKAFRGNLLAMSLSMTPGSIWVGGKILWLLPERASLLLGYNSKSMIRSG